MSTDPTAALQAQMAELLAPLQGHLQALAALLGNAAAAFNGTPADPGKAEVILDPALLIPRDPPPLLMPPAPAPEAKTVDPELAPADLVRDLAMQPGLAAGIAEPSFAPAVPLAAAPFGQELWAPADWFPGADRHGDAGEGSNGC